MSDRVHSLTVTLDHTYKDEDAKSIMDAIRMIKGVSEVQPIIATAETYFAVENARAQLATKLFEVLRSKN